MPRKHPFGVSTHLYHNDRLTREHLLELAGYGFERLELFATRTHFDYHNPAAIADLQEWLADAGLELHAVHAPIGESFAGDRWGPPLILASADADARARAMDETARARRSIDELQGLAGALGVRVALEVIPNELSRVGSLVHFIEEVLDDSTAGVCLDFGHAHMDGDLVDAIETVSEHLITTHVHDNRGRTDDHLVPFEGTIDWPAALTAVQKVGYDGTLVLEIAAHGSAKDTLRKAQQARQRMERLLHD